MVLVTDEEFRLMTNESAADLSAAATDPATPPARLAELAQSYGWLRPAIAENPTAYDGLLGWLGALGDPAVDAALARRASAVQTSPDPTTASVPAASNEAPGAVRRRIPLPLLIGVAAVTVVAVAGATAFVVLRPAARTTDAVVLQSLPQEPTALPWTTPGLTFSTSTQKIAEVDDHRAVFYTPDPRSDDPSTGTGRLALLDADARLVVWNVETPVIGGEDGSSTSGHVVGDFLLVQTYTGRVRALDLDTGRLVSTTRAGSAVAGCGTRDCPDLGGDVLLTGTRGKIERVGAGALTAPRWTARFPAAAPVAFAGGAVVSSGTAIDASTGRKLSWVGDSDAQYFALAGHLLAAVAGEGGDGVQYSILDPANGDALFKRTVAYSDVLAVDDDLLVYVRDGRAHGVDIATGRDRWSVTSGSGGDVSNLIGLPTRTGLIAVSEQGDDQHLKVLDRRTGATRFLLQVTGDSGSGTKQLVGSSADTAILTDGDSVSAVSLRDGQELWSHRVDDGSRVSTVGNAVVQLTPSAGVSLASLVD